MTDFVGEDVDIGRVFQYQVRLFPPGGNLHNGLPGSSGLGPYPQLPGPDAGRYRGLRPGGEPICGLRLILPV